MSDLCQVGAAIEGNSVRGSCRDPVLARGIVRYNGQNCYRFSVKFNVRAQITSELDQKVSPLEPTASRSVDDKLICMEAQIHSIKAKIHRELVSNASATHGATQWSFSNQTAVRILHSHDHIQNAFIKRGVLPPSIE